jgi:hypothetical protein
VISFDGILGLLWSPAQAFCSDISLWNVLLSLPTDKYLVVGHALLLLKTASAVASLRHLVLLARARLDEEVNWV